jgi:hypothetical protein
MGSVNKSVITRAVSVLDVILLRGLEYDCILCLERLRT